MKLLQDTALLARLTELAKRAARTDAPVFTHFLDPAGTALAELAARKQGVTCACWGGYEEAERRLTAFVAGEMPEGAVWPLRWVHCRWDARYGTAHHRDLLGAMMGQGITRDQLGDIVVRENEAFCAALPDMADYLAGALREAGRVTLRCQVVTELPAQPEETGVLCRETVASLRLDALLAAGWKLSRTDAMEMIRQGRVRLNHLPEERPDARVEQGALVSARGKGRLLLEQVQGETKKGRIGVILRRFE